MAQIIINGDKKIKGRLSVIRKKDEDGNIVVSGGLLAHRYIDSIDKIETERYVVEDVDVCSEEFASNEYYISYEFTASSIEVKGLEGVEDNSNETNLPKEVEEEIENRIQKEEEEQLFHKEVYSKWISEKESTMNWR